MEALSYCSLCFNNFDDGPHRHAQVFTQGNTMHHICEACLIQNKHHILEQLRLSQSPSHAKKDATL